MRSLGGERAKDRYSFLRRAAHERVQLGLTASLLVVALANAPAQERRLVVRASGTRGNGHAARRRRQRQPHHEPDRGCGERRSPVRYAPYADAETRMNLMLASAISRTSCTSRSTSRSSALRDRAPSSTSGPTTTARRSSRSGSRKSAWTSPRTPTARTPTCRIPPRRCLRYGQVVRWDLVKKHNNGVWPATVDEWQPSSSRSSRQTRRHADHAAARGSPLQLRRDILGFLWRQAEHGRRLQHQGPEVRG